MRGFFSGARLAVIGGGPAGLMAAEVASAAGVNVDVYEAKGSVGRKFLLAGKGGLNLTHSESREAFVRRYSGRETEVAAWLSSFDTTALRDWARGLDVQTVVGSSGRVFPADMKAAPLLRAWVRRLRVQGVHFYVNHKCLGWNDTNKLLFETPYGNRAIDADAVVLALGGGSWPKLGSDGAWVSWLREQAVDIAPLLPANCGFDVAWSTHFRDRFAGQPLKPVIVQGRQGELIVTTDGIEGGLVYALAATFRDAITLNGSETILIDLLPGRDESRVIKELSRPRGKRSLTEHLRRSIGIEGVKAGLLYEVAPKTDWADPHKLARWIKALPLVLQRPRPLAETISTAGGVRFAGLNDHLMLSVRPGVFCAGEMLDWEAPTGGYLLTACFASGHVAGQGATSWILRKHSG